MLFRKTVSSHGSKPETPGAKDQKFAASFCSDFHKASLDYFFFLNESS